MKVCTTSKKNLTRYPMGLNVLVLVTGLEVIILSDFSLGKRDTCFKMSKVRLFKDLKNVLTECKKNDYSMNHFGENFHFFH